VFDPDAAFMPNYNARRETLEKNVATKNSIVVGN
jgi:hypothetical protein